MVWFKTATVAALLAICAAPAAAQGPREPLRMSRSDLARAVARATDGLASSRLPTGPGGPVVMLTRRERTGDAEVHERLDDVFVAQSGRASVLVGGEISGHRQVSPGEWRGGQITGARTYPLEAGDVLFIPAGLPHQVIVRSGRDFVYMAFKSAAPGR